MMKKTFNIWFFILCACLIVGCDDSDSPAVQALKVIGNTAKFDAYGGIGSIKVVAPSAITAKSDVDWCTVIVNDKTIEVATSVNNALPGRTAIVTISSGKEIVQVPIHQSGDIFDCDLSSYTFPGGGGECSFALKTTRQYTITDLPEWLSYKIVDGRIIFTATEADRDRVADVTIACGKSNIVTAKFTQLGIIDVTGTYIISYTVSGVAKVGQGVVTHDKNNIYNIALSNVIIGTTIKATYNEVNRSFIISAGQYLGNISPYFVYLCAYAGGSINWGSGCQYAAIGVFNADGKVEFTFHDNGTWAGKVVDGIYFGGFDKLLTQGGAYKTGWGSAVNMVMVKQ